MEEGELLDHLTSSASYWQSRRSLKMAILQRSNLSASELPAAVPSLMDSLNVTTAIRNLLYQHCEQRARSASLPHRTPSPTPPPSAVPSVCTRHTLKTHVMEPPSLLHHESWLDFSRC
jgi:hypothetical protein